MSHLLTLNDVKEIYKFKFHSPSDQVLYEQTLTICEWMWASNLTPLLHEPRLSMTTTT